MGSRLPCFLTCLLNQRTALSTGGGRFPKEKGFIFHLQAGSAGRSLLALERLLTVGENCRSLHPGGRQLDAECQLANICPPAPPGPRRSARLWVSLILPGFSLTLRAGWGWPLKVGGPQCLGLCPASQPPTPPFPYSPSTSYDSSSPS